MKITKFYKDVTFLSLFSAVLLCILSFKTSADKTIIVSKDGKGDFTTIQQAIDAVGEGGTSRTKIIVKPGTYREKITIPATKSAISLLGENAKNTILVYGDFASKQNEEGKNIGTTGSSTIFIFSNDFSAKNITFQNDAGKVGQAVAVLITGDRSIFENCRFLGFQDTLYLKGQQDDSNKTREVRSYFKNCYIEGTTDFIFGAATAVFEKCEIYAKESATYLTAASTPEGKKYGFVFTDCKITGDAKSRSVYLGRPWRPFAKTVFINTEVSEVIKPEGWHNWNKPEAEKTTFYGEFNSKGIGSNVKDRVYWSHQLSKKEAEEYSIKNILSGTDNWNFKIKK
ncbi:pectinesterase family protein [Epilithonimonas lactis]|uniref:Pectinesterase n=1 Tax=Epilithonimonas lactis TaxID=421072 RepID=A0A085B693_9FLAO|nr:pectinesterase family protein [Epilithonimonas lactis]KFC17988.1 pectin esterase [Epilithonimonas lactis]SEP89666.1 pectinesterase [Epilithonimonas lactis]